MKTTISRVQKTLFSSLLFSSLLFSSLLFSSLLLSTSCQKENPEPVSTGIDFRDVSMLTPEQLALRENLAKTASLVASIQLDTEAMDEVLQGVNVSIGLGFDEQLRFKEILAPQLKSFKDGRNKAFTNRLKQALANTAKSSSSLEEFMIAEGVQIYWPYSESWDGKTQPYITFNPMNNAEANIAFRRTTLPDGSVVTDSLVVDEEFAMSNPVWVINLCENHEWEFKSAEAQADIIKNTPKEIYQLSVGYVRSNTHYDNFFSGGDEYRFVILGGTVVGNQVGQIKNLATVNVKRSYIKSRISECVWVHSYAELDQNWVKDANNDYGPRQFGLYEHDKFGKKHTLEYSPKVKYEGIEASVGKISIEITSDHFWIALLLFTDRDAFLQLNKTDTGRGLKDGYRVFESGGVRWTLPLRMF